MKISGKLFLFFALAFASAFRLGAQNSAPLQFGVRAGINLSNFGGSDIQLNDNTELNDKMALMGYMAGLTVDYALTDIVYLQSGLDFTTKGAKYKAGLSGAEASLRCNPMYLQLPVHVAAKIPVGNSLKVVLGGGPFVAYGIGGKVKGEGSMGEITIKGQEENFFDDNAFRRFDCGVGINAGFEFGNMSVGIGYDLGLANIARNTLNVGNIEIADKNYKVRTQNAYLALGMRF